MFNSNCQFKFFIIILFLFFIIIIFLAINYSLLAERVDRRP